MAEFERPSAIRPSTSRSRGDSGASGIAAAAAGEQLGHDLGIEGGAAGADPAHGVDELGHVGDPVLQQVADPGGVAGEQLGGVALLDVLAEDEDADLGPAGRGWRARPGGPRR